MKSTINNYSLQTIGSYAVCMNAVPCRSMAVAILLFSAAAAVYAGGWSIITIKDFPDYARAGHPLTLTFSVRQHGNHLLGGLKPTIQASAAGGLQVVAIATPTSIEGEYSATLRLPSPGNWKLRVDSGFNPDDKTRQYNSVVLPALRVIHDTSPVPTAYSEADRGGRLTVSKGCVGCHNPGSDKDFTRKRFAAGDLKAFLSDPSIRKVDMPNLKLKETEISALIAFINKRGPHPPTVERKPRAK